MSVTPLDIKLATVYSLAVLNDKESLLQALQDYVTSDELSVRHFRLDQSGYRPQVFRMLTERGVKLDVDTLIHIEYLISELVPEQYLQEYLPELATNFARFAGSTIRNLLRIDESKTLPSVLQVLNQYPEGSIQTEFLMGALNGIDSRELQRIGISGLASQCRPYRIACLLNLSPKMRDFDPEFAKSIYNAVREGPLPSGQIQHIMAILSNE